MSIKKLLNWKYWLCGLVGIVVASAIATYFYIDAGLGQMYGRYTSVATLTLPVNKPEVFAIRNVNVLTPDSKQFLRNQSVIIRNGVIENVSVNNDIAEKIVILDGQGQYLVPGYTDSHVHLWESENDLLLYIANGVTQIREMNGSRENLRWKKEVLNGRLGPDIFVASPQVSNFGKSKGWFEAWTQNKVNVTNVEGFERAIKSFEEQGYDAIKVSSILTSEDYQMLNEAAKNSPLPMIGHYPIFGTIGDLWGSNQTELAHIEEVSKALLREYGYNSKNADGFADFVAGRVDEISDKLIENNISVTTTLNLIDSIPKQMTDLDSVLDAAEMSYVNPGISEGTKMADRALGWLPDVNRYRFSDNADEKQRLIEINYIKNLSKLNHIVLDSMLKKGVPIMSGTDANVPVMVPGFSLHQELKSLSEVGMANSQVLATTTTVPAKWSKSNTGQISAGYKANLVLLSKNPLTDIDNTRSIQTVIKDGRILSRADLDELLRLVKVENDASRKIKIE